MQDAITPQGASEAMKKSKKAAHAHFYGLRYSKPFSFCCSAIEQH